MPLPPQREQDIQRAILSLLALRGFRVFRRNVAGVMKMASGGFMKVGEKGQSDIYGWHRGTGRHIEVEVKRPGKEPNQLQRAYLDDAHMDGCIAFYADSVDMVEAELKRYGY